MSKRLSANRTKGHKSKPLLPDAGVKNKKARMHKLGAKAMLDRSADNAGSQNNTINLKTGKLTLCELDKLYKYLSHMIPPTTIDTPMTRPPPTVH